MSRLKSERVRLGLEQSDVYSQIGSTRSTYGRWEGGAAIPSDKLAELAKLGFDVGYIVTGERPFNKELFQEAYAYVFKFVGMLGQGAPEKLTAELANELALSIYEYLTDEEQGLTADNVVELVDVLSKRINCA